MLGIFIFFTFFNNIQFHNIMIFFQNTADLQNKKTYCKKKYKYIIIASYFLMIDANIQLQK